MSDAQSDQLLGRDGRTCDLLDLAGDAQAMLC
jgi:hypothetical protein